jgi:hypothetical protein
MFCIKIEESCYNNDHPPVHRRTGTTSKGQDSQTNTPTLNTKATTTSSTSRAHTSHRRETVEAQKHEQLRGFDGEKVVSQLTDDEGDNSNLRDTIIGLHDDASKENVIIIYPENLNWAFTRRTSNGSPRVP